MKLGSLKGGRDGRLIVGSRDGSHFTPADAQFSTLREALDDWERAEPLLRERAVALEEGRCEALPVDLHLFAAPLPRAAAWLDASAYVNHVALMHRSVGKVMGAEMTEKPLIYQGSSDDMLGPQEPIRLADDAWGIDLEAELGVITGDVPMGATPAEALDQVRLLCLLNDVSLRFLQPREFALGFGMLQAKPSTAFGPFAVTPDEVGEAWSGGKLDIVMHSAINGESFGCPKSGTGMLYNFGEIIAHAVLSRRLTAGTIVGSGTISNEQPLDRAAIGEGGVGFSCISEARAIAMIRGEDPRGFLRFGDLVTIEAKDRAGRSVFGKIEQLVRQAEA